MVVLAVWLARSAVGVTMGSWLRALLPALVATGVMAGGIQVTRGAARRPRRDFRIWAVSPCSSRSRELCYALPLLPWIHRERRRYRVVPGT
jgi:hypothetical protein